MWLIDALRNGRKHKGFFYTDVYLLADGKVRIRAPYGVLRIHKGFQFRMATSLLDALILPDGTVRAFGEEDF